MHAVPVAWATPRIVDAAKQALQHVSGLDALRPSIDKVFRAFELVSPDTVRCVVLGLDPYPTPGHAMGLSFSVPAGTHPLPPTLRNIMKEVLADLGQPLQSTDLTSWGERGVLLANASLSMAGETGEHNKVWAPFTRAWIELLQERNRPCVWILWGNDARAFRPLITGSNQRVIESAHPSPLAAHRGFFGSRPFTRCNELLAEMAQPAIDWIPLTAC